MFRNFQRCTEHTMSAGVKGCVPIFQSNLRHNHKSKASKALQPEVHAPHVASSHRCTLFVRLAFVAKSRTSHCTDHVHAAAFTPHFSSNSFLGSSGLSRKCLKTKIEKRQVIGDDIVDQSWDFSPKLRQKKKKIKPSQLTAHLPVPESWESTSPRHPFQHGNELL